ncbi:MAG: helix-turn-helix domain-containing protein [Cyanobacteriota bacterium]|nr:helix-turn-helix domain-containing protein [Cyanobacteriota bacterium]
MAPTAPGAVREQPIPELLHLGEQLARARQTAGVSEADLAQRLRLAPHQLRALEAGDHTRLPEGVFVVALARRVASALHADLEDAIQAVRQSRLMRRQGSAPRPSPSGPSLADATRLEAPRAAAPAMPATETERRDPEPSAPMASGPIDSEPKPSWRPRWPLAILAALVATGAVAIAWRLFPQPRPQGLASAPPQPTPRSAPAPAPDNAPVSSPPPVAAAPADKDSLLLRTSEPSWVEVRDLKGHTLFEGTLTGDQRFPIGSGLEVIAGRPHAVRASVGTAPATPLGGVADIRWKRFSPPGLPLDSPPSPAPSP